MRLNLNWFLFLFSPLEQFEISSYNTSLNYITTYPVELLENFFFINYNTVSFYNLIDLFFIYIIIKGFQLFIKNDGFIFLYIFILVLLTCINFYSFSDFVIYEGAFKYYSYNDVNITNIYNYLEKEPTLPASHYWTLIDLLNTFPILIKDHAQLLQYNLSFGNVNAFAESFYLQSFLPNIILNAKILVAYTWFLAFIIYKGFPTEQNSLEISAEAVNKIKNFTSKWTQQDNLNWISLFDDKDFIFLKDVFLPKYLPYIDNIKTLFREDTSLNFLRNVEINGSNITVPNTMYGWVIFLIVIVAINLATKPYLLGIDNINDKKLNTLLKMESHNLKLTNMDTCSTGNCNRPSVDNLVFFIENNLSLNTINNIFNEIVKVSHKIYPEIFTLDYITLHFIFRPERPFLLERTLDKLNLDLNFFFTSKLNLDLFVQNVENTFYYVTLNTSFINMYSVFFCFVFIFLIIYLLFNKTLSNNSNTIIPNIYQMFGETIYKVSLNLFYSVLGKHLTHPEFFIKINTIFLFLIISNVQGMIPYMSTLTSALTNTFFIALALFISIIITLLDKKGINYFLNLFMPSGCPIFLVLLLIPIEIISYSFRVVSLSVRLFANMMAGHTLLKVIVGFSWVIVFLGNTSLINLFPIVILFILTLLEFGVALIQAYIFTILSCIYLRDIFQGH